MSKFFEDFERFLPSAWFSDGGITLRSQSRGLETYTAKQQIRQPGMLKQRTVAFAGAAFCAASMLGEFGAVSETPILWTRGEIQNIQAGDAFDKHALVHPTHWAHLISVIKASPVVDEDDSQYVDSIF